MLAKNMINMGRKGGKLDVQFHGPYTIAEDLGKGRYRLKDEKGLELKTAYNAARLKMWLEPNPTAINVSLLSIVLLIDGLMTNLCL